MVQCCANRFSIWFATIGVLMLILETGIMVGWSSPNMVRFQSRNSKIPLTANEAAWVASSLNLGRCVGIFLSSLFIELFGTKTTLLLVTLPISVGWMLLTIADSFVWLVSSRLISGLGFAMVHGTSALYLGEVSSSKIRGSLISVGTCGLPLGLVIGTVGETYLPMYTSSLIYLGPCLLASVIFLLVPESPYRLVKTNKLESAGKSIAAYRSVQGVAAKNVLASIKSATEVKSSIRDKLRELQAPAMKRAMLLIIVLFIFPQVCGFFSITFYMQTILEAGKSTVIKPEDGVIYANGFAIISNIVGIRLIDKFGRRLLFSFSGVATALALTTLGIYFYLIHSGVDTSRFEWLPLVCIILYTSTYLIGFMPIPGIILSEIFPSNVKSIASLVAGLTAAFFGFVTPKTYLFMVELMGMHYVFWIYAVFSILALPYAIFVLPETKGKSLEQVQSEFFKK